MIVWLNSVATFHSFLFWDPEKIGCYKPLLHSFLPWHIGVVEDHPSWSGGARTTTRQVNGIGPNLDAWSDPKIFTEKNTQKAASSAFILVRLCCQHHSSGRKSWNNKWQEYIGSWWWEIFWCFIPFTFKIFNASTVATSLYLLAPAKWLQTPGDFSNCCQVA